ncbi:MAG: methyltransferase [Clostridia bacterium]|nr:methyltransferase [Clostridia bacterium]
MHTEPLDNGRFVLVDDTCTFGTDAVLLSEFARAHTATRVCDLGTGCGILPLLWHTKEHAPAVDAVELSAHAAALARASVEQNGLFTHITVWEQDWCSLSLPHGAYDLVTCNPPYFAVGSGKVCPDPDRRLARHETSTTLTDITAAAYRLLKNGGRFCLCHRPERMADVLRALQDGGFAPARLQLVHARADKAPFLLLCEAVKGGTNRLSVLPPHILESR